MHRGSVKHNFRETIKIEKPKESSKITKVIPVTSYNQTQVDQNDEVDSIKCTQTSVSKERTSRAERNRRMSMSKSKMIQNSNTSNNLHKYNLPKAVQNEACIPNQKVIESTKERIEPVKSLKTFENESHNEFDTRYSIAIGKIFILKISVPLCL